MRVVMSPQRNGRGSQKFGARPAFGQRQGPGQRPGQGPKGRFSPGQRPGQGPKGRFSPGQRPGQGPKGQFSPGQHPGQGPKGRFTGKPSGPQTKFQPKKEDSEDYSNESFDDSEASDLNETPDEDEQIVGKRKLSFAKDVNTASSKKGPAQKTPMPKLGAVNGKPQLQNTPLGNEKKPKPAETKKPLKGKPMPVDDDEDEDDSEMGSEEMASFDEMGSEEEEDSLMGVDEESEEEETGESDEDVPKQKAKQDAKKKPDSKTAGAQLKVCGVGKNIPSEKLSSFFASKGFKDVQVEYSAPAACFVATLNSNTDAAKMKATLKGAEFSKGTKLSLLDYVAKPDEKKKDAKKIKDDDEDISGEEMSDEDMSDEEMSDEEMDEMESFDEDEEASDASEEEKLDKEAMKKANQAAKSRTEAVKAVVEGKDKKPKDAQKTSGASVELKAVLTGIAKSYSPDKVKSFLESKGIILEGDVAWDTKASGFAVTVPSNTDLDKVQALRGAKLEKFSISVRALDASGAPVKKPDAPATPKNASDKEKQVPASDSKLLAKDKKEKEGPKSASKAAVLKDETIHGFKVALKGIPKNFSSEQISEFLQSKGVKYTGNVQFAQDASGFVVSLKSKADLDTLKNLKGEKIGGKFRFSVADYVAKSPEPTKQDAKKAVKEPSDEEESEEGSEEDESLNLGEEESSEEEEEEAEEGEDKEMQPKVKQQKTEQPKQQPAPAKAAKPEEKVTLRLAGIPKATPTDKLQDFLKKRGVLSAVVKLQDNVLVATVSNSTEADKLRAMNGVRFNSFVMTIEDLKVAAKKPETDAEKSPVPAGQLQFRARLLSIPSDFAVPKLTNLLKGRGVQTVVVTKENGEYIANCQNKLDYNRLLSLKGQRIDDKVRLMIAPIRAAEQKPQQQQESRKRPAEDSLSKDDKKSPIEESEPVAAKKPRQVDDSAQQCRQLYVGNIPPKATDDEVRKCFSECVGVRVIRRTQARKLFAFVTFDSEQTCELVKNARDSSGGVKIQGERVVIDFCGPKSAKFNELQAEKQKKVEQQAPKQTEQKPKKVAEKVGKKAEKEESPAAAAPKSKLKSTPSPSKQDAKVRFADDVEGSEEEGSDEEMSGDDEEVSGDEEMSGSEDEEMSFDEDGDGDDE